MCLYGGHTHFLNPQSVYKKIKSSKRSKAGKVLKLTVGKKTYTGDSVKDGFYDSISKLKSRDHQCLKTSEHFQDFSSDYHHLLELCKLGSQIPPITEKQSLDLLQQMKPNVNDFFSVSPNHYNYAGPAGWKHFHLLLTPLISNIN